MTSTTEHNTHELEAFCRSCPQPYEVTGYLATMGFTLVFEMGADTPLSKQVAPLPAQYHYERPDGMCVLYLAGRDTPMNGEHFPHHQSRFWACPGGDARAFGWIAYSIALKWSFIWQRPATSLSATRADVA